MSEQRAYYFQLEGSVIEIGEKEQITERFAKRTLVVQFMQGDFHQQVPFSFVNKNIEELDLIKVGDWVRLNFSLRGNRHTAGDGTVRWYNDLVGLSVIALPNTGAGNAPPPEG